MGMSDDMPDLTIRILERIHAQLSGLNERVDHLTDRMEHLTERVDSGFSSVNHRLDSVLKIVGTHHSALEARVQRLEAHMLPRKRPKS
jgi:hypothetical protein